MLDGPPGARVPRPVADVPPSALAGGEAVAKAWLLELLAAAPLAEAGAVPVAELAARGPELCAALLEAVGAQAALERLSPGGDRAALAADAAGLAGAADAAGAAAAVAALRRALWSALAGASLDAATTAALAERVAHVADVVTAAVLAGGRDQVIAIAADLADAEEPWRAAVEKGLAAHRADGAPFALLAVEAADAERLAAAGGEDAAALDAVEPAVRDALGPGGSVVRERAGRLWVVAPGMAGDDARALAERLAAAVAAAAAPHGVPLEVAVGVASCPGDGADAAALAACADERLFGARAAGVPVL
jgi:GGDEF domain-containing protein